MKKITAILLTVILVASLFTSCSNSIAPNIDETVSVSFSEATSRSLTASLEDFTKGNYFWKYAAKKNASDGTGLSSGATGSYEVAGALWIHGGNKETPTAPNLGSVAGFSQGIWDFKLFAYKLVGSDYKLAYQGEVTGVSLKKGSANTVTVTVSPVAGDKGTLKLDNNIALTPAKVSDNPTGLTKVYTVTALGSTAAIRPDDGKANEWTLVPGAYKVNVDFVKDGFTYASGSVVATVYSNITTTVSGSLAELVTKAEFDSDINPDVMNKEASSDSVDLGTLTEAGASDVTLRESTSKVEATVPAAAASQIIKTVAGNEASANTTIDLALRVDTVSATNTTLELEIGMQATVTEKDVANNVVHQTTQKVTELKDSDGNSVISVITIKLQLGLKNVRVQHNGTDMVDLNVSTNGQGYSYDANTGILTIKTSSFSPFAVIYDAPTYVAKIGDKKYTTLVGAVAAASDGDTIVLLSNTAGGGVGLYASPKSGQIKTKTITIDFNGNTYDVSNDLQGSPDTVSQSFHLEEGSKVTLKNGKLTSSNSKTRMLIQNYCDLTLDNMELDATEGTNNIVYVLSNNNGKVVIKDSTITAAEGKVAFDVCRYSNYVGPEVTVEGNSVINGKVEISSSGAKEGAVHKLNVTGGTFNGDISKSDNNPNFVGNITGGTFAENPSAYVAVGYNVNEENGRYVVYPGTIVCTSAELQN